MIIADKTVAEHVAQLWLWFISGYSPTSAVINLAELGMLVVLTLTSRGLSIPMWAIGAICISGLAGIFFVGYLWVVRWKVQEKIQTILNTSANKEWNDRCAQFDRIEKMLLEMQKNE